MKWPVVLLFICLASTNCIAQPSANPALNQLQQDAAKAQALYDKGAYAEAAAIVEKLAANLQITILPEWQDTLYNLACYQARAGQSAQAIDNLKQLVYSPKSLSVEQIQKESDFTSLHNIVEFQQLITRMTRNEAIWKDSSAIATPYKPVLSEDEKVAGLSKFWSEVRFDFPFFGRLLDMDWDKLYMDYLPQVRAAKTTADYYRVLMRFAASLHDSHTNVYPPHELFAEFYARPALRTALIGDKVLITAIADPALRKQGIQIGLEITAINGLPIHDYADQFVAPYISSSTPQDHAVRIYDYLLLSGPVTMPLQLSLKDNNGKIFVQDVQRGGTHHQTPGVDDADFKMLPGNIAYLAVNEFENNAGVKTMLSNFDAISRANSLIIDVRKNGGGDSENGDAILSLLTDKSSPILDWKTLDYRPTYRAWGGAPGWFKGTEDVITPDPAHLFSKPVIVLIGPETFSAAEDFVVGF